MVSGLQQIVNKDRYPVNLGKNSLSVPLNKRLQKIHEVGLLQVIRNSGEGCLLSLVHDLLYRPVDSETGLRVKNPFDGFKGNGTGGTTRTKIKLMTDPKNTLLSVSFDYYKSLVSYRPPQTGMEKFAEPLFFLKWYLVIAINMIIAYPAIRTMQKEFPRQGEKLKNWYASTPVCEEVDCAISTPN